LLLFYIDQNVQIIAKKIVEFSNSNFTRDVIKTFSPKTFNLLHKSAISLANINYSNLKYYFMLEVVVTFISLFFGLNFGMKKGIEISKNEVKSSYEEYSGKQKYVFEKVLDLLNTR